MYNNTYVSEPIWEQINQYENKLTNTRTNQYEDQ